MTANRDDTPKKIGRYVVIDAIGFGAMGAVYKAFDPLIKRTVAIKTIRLDVPPQSPQYRSFIDRFYHEARISGTLSHPNIITLFDIGETEDKIPFLAMEFVEGETVAEFLNRGERFRPEQVIGLVSQMASAIDYAHGKGVIHRDVKPSNVIIHDGEKVKVTDFGIAKLMDTEMTQGGTLLGTPSYMSPEQAMGEALDGRTDIFSLGVVAFEMLCGQQPFPGNNVTSILYKLVHADPVRPSNLEVLGMLPEKWHEVFSKVLAKIPAERYATAAEFVEALEMCLGSWFGSLSGETVIIRGQTDPSLTGSNPPAAPKPALPARAAPPPPPAEDERTVVMSAVSAPETSLPDGSQATQAIDDADLAYVRRETAPAAVEADRTMLAPTYAAVGDVTQTTPPPAPGPPPVTGYEDTPRPSASGFPLTEPMPRPPELPVAPAKARSKRSSAATMVAALVVGFLVLAGLGVVAARFVISRLQTRPEEPPTEVVVPAPPPVESAEPGTAEARGELAIETDPAQAQVTVNGESRGATPLRLSGLAPGDYLIRLEKAGFQTEERSVRLTADALSQRVGPLSLKKVEPAASARGTLEVKSTPSGASVLVDGKPSGVTPLLRLAVAPGKHKVRLQKEGFRPFESELDVPAGKTAPLSVTLQAAEEKKASAPPPPQPAPRAAEPSVKEGDLVTSGPDVVEPRCLKCDPASYPEMAKRLKVEGSVQVGFIVNHTGGVEDIKVEQSGGEILDNAVVEAVKNWKYEPATKKGIKVKIQKSARQRFKLGR